MSENSKKTHPSGKSGSSSAAGKKVSPSAKSNAASAKPVAAKSSAASAKPAAAKSSAASAKPAAAKSSAASVKPAVNGRKPLTPAQRRELERQRKITQILIILGSCMVAFIVLIIFLVISDKSAKKDFTGATSSDTVQLATGVYPAATNFTPAADGEQLKPPAAGEEVAVLETSMGTIKIRLFPEAVPTAVENFKTLIQKGYYDGITFHRVMNDFMIQSGDPTATGQGGECAFEGYTSFQDEFGRNLYNIRGALSMANAGTNTNGSQFFIVQMKTPAYGNLGNAQGFLSNGGAQWAADAYEQYGGAPYLDGQFKELGINRSGHTVFGQVYEGMDVVDAIAAVETDGNDKPLTDVTINRAYLETVA